MKKFKPPLETISPKKLQAKMVSLEKIYQTFKEEVTAIIYKLFPKKRKLSQLTSHLTKPA